MGGGHTMNERAFIDKFRNHLRREAPGVFWYKIPDTLGLGGMRPFDALVIYKGYTWCLEFKVGKNKLSEYQEFCLNEAKRNGVQATEVNPKTFDFVLDHILKGEAMEVVNDK